MIFQKKNIKNIGIVLLIMLALTSCNKEKTEDMYWDLSNNDAYEVKQIYTNNKSPDSLSTVYIDKIKGTILFKKFNINEPSQFRYLKGNCKPKESVKIIK